MPSLVPYLTFRHGAASLEFLTSGLGFEVVTEQRDDDGVVHAELRRGDAVPEQTEWGNWRARFRDVDGHEWSIGTYEPGQSW